MRTKEKSTRKGAFLLLLLAAAKRRRGSGTMSPGGFRAAALTLLYFSPIFSTYSSRHQLLKVITCAACVPT